MAQVVSIQYFDPAQAQKVNIRFRDIRPRGIYSGGYLTKITDDQVRMSPVVVEIGDSLHQVKISEPEDTLVNIPGTTSTTYIVMRWAYAESNANTAMITAISAATLQANDLIIGVVVYTGSQITGIDYTLRTEPRTHEFFLKVEPAVPADFKVRVRPGNVNYGVRNYTIVDTSLDITVAPLIGTTRIALVYADTDGAVKVAYGDAVTIPVVPADPQPVPPLYNGKSGLAEITTVYNQVITAAAIKDVRAFLSGGGYAIYAP